MRYLAFAIALGLVTGAPAVAQEAGDPEAGYQIAKEICAECHDVESVPATLFGLHPLPFDESEALPFEEIAGTPGVTTAALFVWMTSTHPTMPDIVLEKQELRDVVAYIISLREE